MPGTRPGGLKSVELFDGDRKAAALRRDGGVGSAVSCPEWVGAFGFGYRVLTI
jgi:hypothetical protein